MLSGSTILRVVVLFVVAAGLAGLVQIYWPYGGGSPAPAPVQRPDPPRAAPSRNEPAPDPTPPARETGAALQPPPQSPPAAPQAQTAPAQPILPPSPIRPLSKPAAPPANGTDASGGPAAPLADSPPLRPGIQAAEPPPSGRDAAGNASDAAGPRAVSVVDLNTGSLAELNGLKGGGMIGRAIVQRRPYTSVDQLLSKRVLSRSTYDRIKDQVTVQ